VFDAPVACVAWWTQAEKLKQWSGLQGCHECEIEWFLCGGSFTQKMHIRRIGEFRLPALTAELVEPEKDLLTTLDLASISE